MLVIIDGLDASGKDTQANILILSLQTLGKSALLRVHPAGDNPFGIKARQFLYLKGRSAHFASALFYMLDVLRSVAMYSWRKYDYVVFVRYLMGTAYLPSPLHAIAYRFFALIVPTSDSMFFLDVTPEEAERRIKESRPNMEMFENLVELKRIRLKALSLASASRWRVLDASRPANDIAQVIAEALHLSPSPDNSNVFNIARAIRVF